MKFSDLQVGTIIKINSYDRKSFNYSQVIYIDTESLHELHETLGLIKHKLPITIYEEAEFCPEHELEIAKQKLDEKKVEIL